jgi:hypothetical protein
VFTNGCNGRMIQNLNPKPSGSKSGMESYSNSYTDSYTCGWPLRRALKLEKGLKRLVNIRYVMLVYSPFRIRFGTDSDLLRHKLFMRFKEISTGGPDIYFFQNKFPRVLENSHGLISGR